MKRFRFRFPLLICLFMAAAGCSLRDYESQIDEQQKRIALIDDENRILSDCIDVPMIEGKDRKIPAWPFDVFLRLPHDTATQSIASYALNGMDPRLFLYRGSPGYNVFLAAGFIPIEKEKGVELHKGKGESRPEWPIETFRMHVRGALMDYCRKELKINPEFPLFSKFQKIVKQPIPDRDFLQTQVDYDAIASKVEPTLFQAYFRQLGDRQFAIIFQLPVAAQSDGNVTTGIDWSLKTLDIGQSSAQFNRNALLARRNWH
jgi:hypothetical protein